MPIAEPEHDLPLSITPSAATGKTPDSLIGWVKAQGPALRTWRLRHGALLFRDFCFASPPELEALVSTFTTPQRYTGGASARRSVEGNVYTSTDTPAHYPISQHHESAYTPTMPNIIGFFCCVPATTGGQTPLADARRVTARLPAELKDRFTAKGLCYVNNLPNRFGLGKSWQAQFESEDRAQVEAILRAGGYEWVWNPDGSLRTQLRCPALRPHPETGELLWVNQADHWHPSGLSAEVHARMRKVMSEDRFPVNVTFGDGSQIPEDDLALVRAVVRAETRQFDWQAGDVLVFDNYLVSHGRRSYTGERKLYVALG